MTMKRIISIAELTLKSTSSLKLVELVELLKDMVDYVASYD